MSKLYTLQSQLIKAEEDAKIYNNMYQMAQKGDKDKINNFEITFKNDWLEARKKVNDIEKSIKECITEYEELYHVKVINTFEEADCESGKKYYIFEKLENEATKENVKSYLETVYNLDIEGYEINSPYDCTGQKFCHPVNVEETTRYFIASQWWGLDV